MQTASENDKHGRPIDKVQIIHRGKNNTRIKRSADYGRSWDVNDQQVPADTVLLDGGQRFTQHSTNPKHASYVDSFGQPQARLRLHRVYTHTTKATFYLGDNTWTMIEDVPTSSILFDGSVSAGWMIPDWVEQNPDGQGDSNLDVGEKKDKEDSHPPVEPTVNRLMAELVPRFEKPGDTPSPVSFPSGQRFSYIRVSSTDQNLARQRDMIGVVDKEFIDEVSAKSRAGRPGL